MIACKSCGVSKTAAEYRTHKRGYRIGRCRVCERAYQRECSRRDPEKYRARKRQNMASRRASDPDAVRAYQRDYHANNRVWRTRKMREYAARRFFWNKANKLRGDGAATHFDLARLWKQQRGRCALTGRKLDRTAEPDHKTPRSRGGGDDIANLQWLCREVNRAKRDLPDAEFIALCSNVMRWIGTRIQAVENISGGQS